jgi:hypothetical protein
MLEIGDKDFGLGLLTYWPRLSGEAYLKFKPSVSSEISSAQSDRAMFAPVAAPA